MDQDDQADRRPNDQRATVRHPARALDDALIFRSFQSSPLTPEIEVRGSSLSLSLLNEVIHFAFLDASTRKRPAGGTSCPR